MKTAYYLLVMQIFIVFIVTVQIKSQHQIKSGVIANGGTAINNESNKIVGTIGQSLIGRVKNQSDLVKIGFWEQTFDLITRIETEKQDLIPSIYYLYQNYPNPFNPSTNIRYSLPERTNVSLKIFNLLGSEVAELVNNKMNAGSYNIYFTATSLPSGVYFCQLKAGVFVETKKMLLLK